MVYLALGGAFLQLHRYEEAIQQARQSLELDPNFARAFNLLSIADLFKGAQAEAIHEAERAVVVSDSGVEYLGWLGFVYGMVGQKAEAGKLLARVQQLSKTQFVSPALYALIYAGTGDRDHAFQWLNRALESHDPALEGLRVDPTFDSLRGDQRFTELIKKVGFPQ